MPARTFYEILEDQIRTEIRREIEAELRSEMADGPRETENPKTVSTSHTYANAGAAHLAYVGDIESWLLSHNGTTKIKTPRHPRHRAYYGSKTSVRFQTSTVKEKTEPRATPTTPEGVLAVEILQRLGGEGLPEKFTKSQLKSVWRKAALRTHPDRFSNSDAQTQLTMGESFRELASAYQTLLALFT